MLTAIAFGAVVALDHNKLHLLLCLPFAAFLIFSLFSFVNFLNGDRLAGVTLLCPVVNYWWPSFPSKLSTEAYYQQFPEDQWALRVAHHAPWLVYWWNTQKWFPASSVAAGKPNFTPPDLQVLSKFAARLANRVLVLLSLLSW